MQRSSYYRNPLSMGVAVALGTVAASPTHAQDVVEEVKVSGIRSSLRQSMEYKRAATGVVDAISAEDIGDFPDTNLAESLQRITGVSIDRERGEGAKVTVRGFGPEFNLVLLNGRQMPTTSGTSRSFDFGNLASEGVSAVEVYKSGKADVPTGGIGSTINIKTNRPLESPGRKFLLSGSMMNDDSRALGSSDFTPEVSGLFSDTFNDDTVGVSLSLSHQERESGRAQASVGGWRTFPGSVSSFGGGGAAEDWGGIPVDANQQNRPGDDDLYSVPQVVGYELADFNRTRTNGQLTLQFRPQDAVTATLDYTFADLELDRTYNNLSSWFNFGGQESVWSDGPQASPLEYTENSSGSDFAMGTGTDAFKNENSSLGLNLMWDVSDQLTMAFDYHDSTAENSPNSPFGNSALLAIAAFTRDTTSGFFGSELPVLQLGLSDPLSADDMIVTGSVFVNEFSKMDINQFKLSGNYGFDHDFITGIDFGVQITEVDNRAASSVVQRDAWGGVTQPGAIADLMMPASIAGSFSEIPGGGDPRLQTDFFTYDLAALIARTEALIASGDATLFVPGNGDLGRCGTGLCPSDDLGTDRRTTEESDAVYAQLNLATEWGSKPVDIRLGVRYEQTDVFSEALSPNYTGLTWVAGNELSLQSMGAVFTSGTGDYDYFLPNFDFSMDFTDQLIGRVSISKTLTRPGYQDIQGGLTLNSPVRVNGGTGARGNAALMPFESSNIDLSMEFYYGEDNYAAAGYFRKEVDNFIGSSAVTEQSFGLPHPALGPLGDEARAATGSSDGQALYDWILANRPTAAGVDPVAGTITGVAGRDPASPFDLGIPVNQRKATLDGFELVVQHNFGDTGFGVIANATIVDGDVSYDNMSLADQFVLDGLSDSANLIGYYEKHGAAVRLAYNWRDDFLAGKGQTNVGAVPPTYTGDYEQWDLSSSYEINDSFQVFLDVINLTDETTHQYGRDTLQTLFATQLGTRYNLGFRYKY